MVWSEELLSMFQKKKGNYFRIMMMVSMTLSYKICNYNDSILVGIGLLVDHICYLWQVMLLALSFLCLMLVPFFAASFLFPP